MFLQNSRCCRG